MDTAIEREFAGGRFTFYLPLPAVLAVEKGPVTPSLRVREYPVSVFQIYDELSVGIGLDVDGKLVRLPGASIFIGDLHNIIERALVGGNAGEKDGEMFEVDAKLAARVVNENLMRNVEGCSLLAWDILHSLIKGVDLKKKDEPVKPKRQRRSAAAK